MSLTKTTRYNRAGAGNFVENPLTAVETHVNNPGMSSLTCYPNPFKDKTTIEYSTDNTCSVDISIYNTTGQKIKTLENKTMEKGKHTYIWDGTDKNGKEVYPGIYLAVLQMNRKPQQTTKLLKQQ